MPDLEHTTLSEAQLDYVGELANIGAGHAATAFARLVGRTIRMQVPRIRVGDSPLLSEGVGERDTSSDSGSWSTGVFFQFDGQLTAVVGILFHGASSEAAVRAVVGEPDEPLSPHSIESALMEIGNILASHVASAIADTLGVRLLPSIPTLAMHHAEETFQALVNARDVPHPVRIECPLTDEQGELGGLLVLVPEERRPGGAPGAEAAPF